MENIDPNINRSDNSAFFIAKPDCEFYFPNYRKCDNNNSKNYDPEKMGVKIKLNRSALAYVSPEFGSLFYGGVEDGVQIEKDPIYIIEDVDLKTFKTLLKFIRDGNVVFESVEETVKLLKAALKFKMENLLNVCIRWLQSVVGTKYTTDLSEIAVKILDKASYIKL